MGVTSGRVYDFDVKLIDKEEKENDPIAKEAVRMVNVNAFVDIAPGETKETTIAVHSVNPSLEPGRYNLERDE